MPRSKKSAGQPPPNQNPPDSDAHESAENEGMAHVRPDELAGGPDVFSRKESSKESSKKSSKPAGAEAAAFTAGEPEVTAAPEPAIDETPSEVTEPIQAPAPDAPVTTVEPAMADEPVEPTIPIPPPPLFVPTAPPPQVPAPPPDRRGGSGIALGVVLVVVGAFYLLVQVLGIDLSTFGWPLFVIIPGLTLLIVGLVSLGTGAAIPGGILTMVGLVLAYQNSTNNWASWAYAWALVAPGGVGVGLFLQGLREGDAGLIKQGRNLMFIAALIFIVGFVFFESILNISGMNDQPVVKAALPALFIVVGILLLGRSIQNSRRA